MNRWKQVGPAQMRAIQSGMQGSSRRRAGTARRPTAVRRRQRRRCAGRVGRCRTCQTPHWQSNTAQRTGQRPTGRAPGDAGKGACRPRTARVAPARRRHPAGRRHGVHIDDRPAAAHPGLHRRTRTRPRPHIARDGCGGVGKRLPKRSERTANCARRSSAWRACAPTSGFARRLRRWSSSATRPASPDEARSTTPHNAPRSRTQPSPQPVPTGAAVGFDWRCCVDRRRRLWPKS